MGADDDANGARAARPRHWFERVRRFLFKPISATPLATFRIVFGLFMVYNTYRMLRKNYYKIYSRDNTPYNNAYEAFVVSWWPLLTYEHFKWSAYVMGVSSFTLAVGFCTRTSALIWFITHTWSWICEVSTFNNHYYLFSLVGGLFCFVDSYRWWSVDLWLMRRAAAASPATAILAGASDRFTPLIPQWQVLLVQFQLAICYFFGFVNKVNGDWLRGQPMLKWIGEKRHLPFPLDIIEVIPDAGYWMGYGGLMLDLCIAPALWYPRTRVAGALAITLFHYMNSQIWSIGMFPYVMGSTTILFFAPSTFDRFWNMVRRVIKFVPAPYGHAALPGNVPPGVGGGGGGTGGGGGSVGEARTIGDLPPKQRRVVLLLLLYAALQILVPLRHWVYPDEVNWTKEGHYFAWRMMLNDEDCFIRTMTWDETIPHEQVKASDVRFVRTFALVGLTKRQQKRGVLDPGQLTNYMLHASTLDRERLLPNRAGATADKGGKRPIPAIGFDHWRRRNDRPFQRWFYPQVDHGHSVRRGEWLYRQVRPLLDLPDWRAERLDAVTQTFRKKKGYNSFIFAEYPATSWHSFMATRCKNEILVEVLEGGMTITHPKAGGEHTPLDDDVEYATLKPGDRAVAVPTRAHTFTTVGSGRATVFAFLFKVPRYEFSRCWFFDSFGI